MSKKNRQELLENLITQIAGTDETFHQFLLFLYEHNFFNNISEEEIHEIINEETYIFKLKRRNISVGIQLGNKVLVGIDPSDCFDSIKRSSIIIEFPQNKRGYKRVINELSQIFDAASQRHKMWLKEAPSLFNGEWII